MSEEDPSLCPTFLIESYLEHQGESFSTKFDPNSLLYISKAMDMFDVAEGFPSLEEGLERVKCPIMVVGVQTDVLFPIWQQRELAEGLQKSGNDAVTYYELNSIYGHDTFLLDLNGVGAAVKVGSYPERVCYGPNGEAVATQPRFTHFTCKLRRCGSGKLSRRYAV
nr:hypothetical protein BaRGS_011452 [Batillaria attramentaria]